jgi:enolase
LNNNRNNRRRGRGNRSQGGNGNQLNRIEEQLGETAVYAGRSILR